jgi:hypothetical protein
MKHRDMKKAQWESKYLLDWESQSYNLFVCIYTLFTGAVGSSDCTALDIRLIGEREIGVDLKWVVVFAV